MNARLRWITPPVLALALYWPALRLPFFWDDVPNFNFMEGRALLDLWTSAAGFPYYRPLGFTAWYILHWFFDPANTWAHHALNLLALTANGWLVGVLAVQLAARSDETEATLFGWVAGALLTAFPFAALAVPLVASLFHLHVALMALAAGVSLLAYMRRGERWRGALALVFAGLAPFVHESGIGTGGMLAMLWLFAPPAPGERWLSAERRRGLAVVGLALLLNALFVPLWLAVPKMRTGGNLPGGLHLREMWLNAVFFVVSWTFPAQPLALTAQRDWGWVDVTAVLTFGGAALFLMGLLAWRAGRVGWLLAGFGYAAVAALPAILALKFLYVIVSPRLMVFGAPGVALMWSAAVVSLISLIRRRARAPDKFAPVLAGALSAALLFVPARHIWREVQLHVCSLAPVWGLVRAVEAHPDARHLVVNPTTWLAMSEATYPIAHEGVVVIPEYVNPAQLVEVHTRGEPSVDGVAFPPIFTEPAAHYYDVWGVVMDWETLAEHIRAADHVWLVTYGDGPLELVEVGQRLAKGAARAGGQVASFDQGRVILEATLARVDGSLVRLYLDWRVREPVGDQVFAHALDCDGDVLGLADGPPVGRMYPFALWRAGEAMRDLRSIPLEARPPDDCYQVEVGLFDPADGSRPAALAGDGRRLPNDALYLAVETR